MHFTEKQNNVQAFVNLKKAVLILQVIMGFTFCFCYQTTYYAW